MLSRKFNYLSLPPKSGTAKKLVVLIHGYGFNASFMRKQAEEIQKSVPDAMIIMPQAPELYEPAGDGDVFEVPQQVTENKDGLKPDEMRQWFSFKGTDDYQDVHKRVNAVAQDMADFIDECQDGLNLADEDVAMMGFSQGGGVALYAAYRRKRPMACVVGHSTLVFAFDAVHTPKPTFFIYGDSDEEFSQKMYAEVIDRLQKFVPDFAVEKIKGLKHVTNAESRSKVAGYIKKKLDP